MSCLNFQYPSAAFVTSMRLEGNTMRIYTAHRSRRISEYSLWTEVETKSPRFPMEIRTREYFVRYDCSLVTRLRENPQHNLGICPPQYGKGTRKESLRINVVQNVSRQYFRAAALQDSQIRMHTYSNNLRLVITPHPS